MNQKLPIIAAYSQKLDIDSLIDQYGLLGIKVIGFSKDDKLFFDTILPNKWRYEPSNEPDPNWSLLIDEKARVRAKIYHYESINYKEVFVQFTTRYIVERSSEHFIVKDTVTNKCLFKSTATHCYGKSLADIEKNINHIIDQIKDFLRENYPEYEDYNAYWD